MTRVIETYELSPMQAGTFFHAVSGGHSGVDIEQIVATLHEPLDEAHFLRAWHRVAERHPILRSRFRWEGVADPVQDSTVPFEEKARLFFLIHPKIFQVLHVLWRINHRV